MSGNVMGSLGVTLLAIIGTAVVAVDRFGKQHKVDDKEHNTKHH
ncbi:hypothetical protein [Acidithiobacillus acidisediminis]|nr:hypothetical protein [Acidithiobacillus sp. S30A2]